MGNVVIIVVLAALAVIAAPPGCAREDDAPAVWAAPEGFKIDKFGQTIFVQRRPYAVVGVLEKRDSFGVHFGFSWEKSVFVPMLTAEKRDGRSEMGRFFIGLTEDPAHNDTVEKMMAA